MSKKAMEVCERCGWLHQQCTCDKQLLTEIDRLSADKGELYQMLKAIVDTHRAGYAWMDMTKPQALLDRVVADHDELTLWTIEQLRAELERLKKEAHDKHWPLANACRNLLPHSNEDNVTQVWAASRKLEQLRAENKELSTALAEAVEWITEELDNIGGCDHSVGICVCSDRAMLKGLKKLLARRMR